jgi:hypothetical protein
MVEVAEKWWKRRLDRMAVPIGKLSGRKLIVSLRELIDKVSDPEFRFKHPDEFALSYHRLLFLIDNYPDVLETKSVRHNLGGTRLSYIDDINRERGATA